MRSSIYILSAGSRRRSRPISEESGANRLKKKHLGVGIAVLAAMVAAVVFVVYRWRTSGFAWNEFTAALRHVDWSWLALALALILATYVGRALRWEIMLRPLSERRQFVAAFYRHRIGFTAVVLFGRAGEPVRPYLIAKKEGVSFSSQIAAWLVERILDLLMVLLIFGIALTQVSAQRDPAGPQDARGPRGRRLCGWAHRSRLSGPADRPCASSGDVSSSAFWTACRSCPRPLVAKSRKFLASFEEGMQSTRSASLHAAPGALHRRSNGCVIAGGVFLRFPGVPGDRRASESPMS